MWHPRQWSVNHWHGRHWAGPGDPACPNHWPSRYWHANHWSAEHWVENNCVEGDEGIDEIHLEIDFCVAIQARIDVTNGIVTHITATPAIQARIATP